MSPRVLLLVDQLQRPVPGGIGTSIRGLLGGLCAELGLTDASARPDPMQPGRDGAPAVTLHAGRRGRREDRLGSWPLPVERSRLPGPVMTRLWDGGLSDVPRGFEIVHAMSLAAPPARNARRIVTVHDVTWREVPDAFPARGRRWHERALTRVLGSDALVVTPSERVEKELEAAGADPARLRVIPWGSDHLPPADLDAAQRLLSQLRVEGDFLLSVGTREPRKNLARVIAAFRRARPLLPGPWPLVVVGPPGWGLDVAPVEGVIVTGSLDDAVLSALYSRAKMLVYAPIAEGFGLPPLEAMREGLPVVSSPVPSSGGAVYEVDPLDVEQITDAIVEVASDDRTRSRLVAAGRAHSEALTWRASARAHVALWRSLA